MTGGVKTIGRLCQSREFLVVPTRSAMAMNTYISEEDMGQGEYERLLSSEVTVDIEKLREDALVQGVPNKMRDEVWLYLLGVRPTRKVDAERIVKEQRSTYEIIEKQHTATGVKAVREWQNIWPKTEFSRNNMYCANLRNVLGAYYNETGISYRKRHVHLLAPLLITIHDEVDLYFAFTAVMERIEGHSSLKQQHSECMRLVRSRLSQMVSVKDEDDFSFSSCVLQWLDGMLTTNLPVDDVLRLWDAYLAKGFGFHKFVCVSLLEVHKDVIDDMDSYEEFSMFARHIPPLGMHEVLCNAELMEEEPFGRY